MFHLALRRSNKNAQNQLARKLLPLLAAGLLTQEPLVIKAVPQITDVEILLTILRDCGAEVVRNGGDVSVCNMMFKTILADILHQFL